MFNCIRNLFIELEIFFLHCTCGPPYVWHGGKSITKKINAVSLQLENKLILKYKIIIGTGNHIVIANSVLKSGPTQKMFLGKVHFVNVKFSICQKTI